MRLRHIISAFLASMLAATVVATDVAGATVPASVSSDPQGIVLNGLVADSDPGRLGSKSVIMTSATPTSVTYRLVPQYTQSYAAGVKVRLHLPSLEFVDGKYKVVARDAAPTALGVQGEVRSGGGWVVHTPGVVKGGYIELEYEGNLQSGSNPAFELVLSTYNDGSTGPYGGVPEGFQFSLNGFVSYEQFGGDESRAWETPGLFDEESKITVVATDLKWEPNLVSYAPNGGSTSVPMWDRFQYFDYVYTLQNTSTNPASNVEAYSVNLQLQTTDSINGIIPSDINRWTYNGPDAAPTMNDDAAISEGQFIGVPDQGGVLIYDVTEVYSADWNGTTGLGDPLPYSYDGAGMVTIDRTRGDARDKVAPGDERVYLAKLPMSRQGFPNTPTSYKVDAITNIVLGENTNWSKTKTALREVLKPTYGFDFKHTPEKAQSVYAQPTYTQITGLKNSSDVPVFTPSIEYATVSNFRHSEIVYLIDAEDAERFKNLTLSYNYTVEVDDEEEELNVSVKPTFEEDLKNAGRLKATFDVSAVNSASSWDGKFTVTNVDKRLRPGEGIPLTLQFHGTPMEVTEMSFPAVTTYVEKYANNEDYTAPTTYAEVPRTVTREATIDVVYPDEVFPRNAVRINGSSSTAESHKGVVWGAESTLGFHFGTNDEAALTSKHTITVNTVATEALRDARMVIKPGIFAAGDVTSINVIALDGAETVIDLSQEDLSQPITVALADGFSKIVVETGNYRTDGAQNFIDVIGTVDAGLKTSHTVKVESETYQPAPFDKTNKSSATGYMSIQLPADLNPSVSIVGIYGDRRTANGTTIPYEVPVSAEYRLSTGGVKAPEFTYTITEDAPTKLPATPTKSQGILVDGKLTVSDALAASASDLKVTFVDSKGNEQSFMSTVVDYDDITLDAIASIVISGKNLRLSSTVPMVTIDYDSQLDMGASQILRAKFVGTPNAPYVSDTSASDYHPFLVQETRSTIEVEGLNQVEKAPGAGSSYDQWVDRQRSCGYSCTMSDYTLDQGYKTLGGFGTTLIRPTIVNSNNDQTTVIDVNMPHSQFDMYYVKIRDDLKPYIQDVQIFRMVDGKEELWRSIPASEWVENTSEGSKFWRINTGHQDVDGAALFETKTSTSDADHPYYKGPFAANVVPDQPVSRVSVTLRFERKDYVSTPQLAGTTSRVIEYMGRFYETSEEGKKATASKVEDTFGQRFPITRNHVPTPVYSLVHYPFAQAETGAEKNVSTQRAIVTMGTEGEYLANIWNVANQYYGGWHWPHGKDINVPAATESDEWMMSYYNKNLATFHDNLAYKFTYPATPEVNAEYSLDPTQITVTNTATLKYLTSLSIQTAKHGEVSLELDAEARAEILAAGKFVVTYDNTLAKGFHQGENGLYTVSLGTGVYPVTFEAIFSEIDGFGDTTTELQGEPKETLGSSLSGEIDIRVAGIVNGNKELTGKTEIFRVPNDSPRTLTSTSTGVLVGYTPKLGATMDMSFDQLYLYDYGTDGITPNTTRVEAGMTNSAEADIKSFQMTVNLDPYFRSQKVKIPATIFDGRSGDWEATTVTLSTPSGNVAIPLDRFVLKGENYVLDVDALYEGDEPLLTSKILTVDSGGTSKLDVREVTKVAVDFTSVTDGVVMWGTTSIDDQRALEDDLGVAEPDRKVMPKRMISGSYVVVTGDWVDEAISIDGVEKWSGERAGWDSKPAARADGTLVTDSTWRTAAFTTSAKDLKTPLSIYTPAATSGNAGVTPSLTYSSVDRAPRVYHRTVDMQFRGAHLDNDLALKSTDFPFDAETNAHVANTDLVVGDTTKVLYELRNSAAADAEHRNSMFDPSTHFTAPDGMRITGLQVVTPNSVTALHTAIAELGRTNTSLTEDQFEVNDTDTPDKSRSVQFKTTLAPQESVWIFVEYEAINDFSNSLDATEDKSVVVRSYATAGVQHHIQNFNGAGVSTFDGKGYGVSPSTGSAMDHNKDGLAETSVGLAATLQFASADVVEVNKTFDVESLSGTPMTMTVDKMSNQIRHDNTQMLVDIVFDTNARGFVLTEMPVPTHVAGFAAPVVTHVYIDRTWVKYVEGAHDLDAINGMRVDYGIVPAYMKDGSDALVDFKVPSFEIAGIGHWQNYGGVSTKSSVIRSTIDMALTHRNGGVEGNPEVARYTVTDVHESTIYKGLHDVELNLQSFDSKAESLVEYSNAQASKIGKSSYLPGETIWNKVSVRNANAAATANTGRGKAPVLDPVIYDKVPEYMTAALAAGFVAQDGTVDVAGAVAAGLLVVKHFGKDGNVIDGAKLPEVRVTTIKGLDVAGSQQFANDLHNNRHGKLSSAEPVNTAKNPAAEIDFELFTYTFDQDLGRGERFEVMYPVTVRTKDLPYATYADGRQVWAPFLGWYASNDVLASNAHQYDMDMAALLHDVGFSGTRSHEMTQAEFLSDSTSWVPGQNRERLQPESYYAGLDTYFDATANSQYVHDVEMVEEESNQLRETDEGSDPVDQNWRHAMVARVNDGKVTHRAPNVNDEGSTRQERVLWAEDNLQLKRAWVYGASEIRPEKMRQTPNSGGMTARPDETDVNFIEFKSAGESANTLDRQDYTSRYTMDDYSYAVELDEKLDIRLHASNLGDRAIESGVEYTEILPVGFTPFAEDGSLLGVQAFSGNGVLGDASDDIALSEKITGTGTNGDVTVEIVQSPTDDHGLRAPAQNQEAGSYKDATTDHGVPYVVKIQVATPLKGMFLSATSTVESKYQYVDLSVRVDGQAKVKHGDHFYWYDQLTVSSIAAEPYMAIYSHEYGAFDRDENRHNVGRHENDSIWNGLEINDLRWYHYPSYTTYYSFEPHGQYIRGINAQGTAVDATVAADTDEMDARPSIVTGDQVIMRKPTLRVWNDFTKDEYLPGYDRSAQDFTTDLNDRFTIHATVENQQVEAQGPYHHHTASSTDKTIAQHGYLEKWENQHQTIGGGRGSWFDPTVTVVYPFGIAPVLEDGQAARYDKPLAGEQQKVAFTAAINDVTYRSRAEVADVTEHLDVRVEKIQSDQGERFVLLFTIKENDAARAALRSIKYGQSLVVSPQAITVDTPPYTGSETLENQKKFQNVLTLANTEVDVFEPIVSAKYPTGSTPERPTQIDRYRTDTTGSSGEIDIPERLISATSDYAQDSQMSMHTAEEWTVAADTLLPEQVQTSVTNYGAYGGSRIAMRNASVINDTTVDQYSDGSFADTGLLAPASKFWVSTKVSNSPATTGTAYNDLLNVAHIQNSRFVVNAYVTSFANKTGEVQLVVGGKTLSRERFEELGWTVDAVTFDERVEGSERQLVRWIVTPPALGQGEAKGRLGSGDSFTLLQQYHLVDGFREDSSAGSKWTHADLSIDSYVSLIADDETLAPEGEARDYFVVQPVEPIRYGTLVDESTAGDIDGDGEAKGFLAHDPTTIEIAKPQGEIRVNTTRPRMEYSNGSVGDPYFNSNDTIEYMVTHAKNTGSGLKEMVIDSMLPASRTKDSTFNVATRQIETTLNYVTSGKWEIPQRVLTKLTQADKSVDDVFETEVYVSGSQAEDGFDDGEWISLGTSSITKNTHIEVPKELQADRYAVRVVLRSVDADFLVPTNARLAIDADPTRDGMQDVTETDPDDRGSKVYPEGVTDAAITVAINARSDVKQTAFIYNEVELWGNYIADAMAMVSSDQVRAYLTPSRPVTNVFHSALYYRSDSTKPADQRWGWSDNMTVNPQASQHMKFRGEVINASEKMWNDDESITYAEDRLIDPVMAFELPSVMTVDSKKFKYVADEDLATESPLHDDHRSRYALSPESDAYYWTWKLVGGDGGEPTEGSYLDHVQIHVGPWDGVDRNLVTVWFEGEVLPGDKIVVDFIGLIDSFVPGSSANDRKSTVYMTNNTGLVQPLNSDWNLIEQHPGHKLGYESDRADFDDNGLLNDRLVFNEQTLFSFEVFDNFGKRKMSFSDLNSAGTAHPQATAVREGGTFTYSLTLDNTREQNDAPYLFPSMYDVLPHVGDTDIQNTANLRGSKDSSVVDLDSFKLSREGAGAKTYASSEYTIFVGPFTKVGNTIEAHETLISPADAKSGSFFDSLGTGSTSSSVREKYFVKLSDLRAAASTKPELLSQMRTVLVLFNQATEQLNGQHKLKLTYDMKTAINAPALIESRDADEAFTDYAQWNSFVGMQKKDGFIPQESNRAGIYITERADRVSIGNYVWNDSNHDGKFTGEGETMTDRNGRRLLVPVDGQEDPGINGVKVTLLTAGGHYADELGNPVKQVADSWVVVDDVTGETFIDEIGQTQKSTGPVVTTTQNDYNGRAGYYIFSNIAEGIYRVMYEMPNGFERHWATTATMTSGADLEVFAPTVAADVEVANDKAVLSMVTDAQTITTETADTTRMGFDLGVGEWLEFGGVVFNDANRDGRVGSDSKLAGYTVELLDAGGSVVTDLKGAPYAVTTKSDGEYLFRVLPVPGVFSLRVTYPAGKDFATMPVTPIIHAVHPFTVTDDNDAFAHKTADGRVIRTNDFRYSQMDLSEYFEKNQQFRGVNFGFYARKDTGVIGDRVWDDLNRNGVQDLGEPGIKGQQLWLDRFVEADGEWVKDDSFSATATSGDDGLYAFKDVQAYATQNGVEIEYRYQVRVEQGSLVKGYTFAERQTGDDRQVDSDFGRKGTMGINFISLVDVEDGSRIAVDDTTIDLGLHSTAKGVIAGEIFIDGDEDGLKTGDRLAAERFTVQLQVTTDGENWSDVPGRRVTGVNKYRFEGLEIFNDADGVNLPNEYRVVVTEIPLWLAITDDHVGTDVSTDSDFTESGRAGTFTALSETYFLGETVEDEYFPINTRVAVNYEAVDLGLLEPKVAIGGTMWDDTNANGIHDDGEKPVAGGEIVLWEKVDGEWSVVASAENLFEQQARMLGVGTPATQWTDENGKYRFEVSPLHYEDESGDNFLTARKYRVTAEREGWQAWSPFQQGGDKRIDSDVITPAIEFGYELTGVSDVFDLIDEVEGKAVATSLRDDQQMDLGVTTFAQQVTIGGRVWEDTNLNGIQGRWEESIPEQLVALQEKVDGEWTDVVDLDGAGVKATDAQGRYAFAVAPTYYEVDHELYLQAREYRVISDRLGNQEWAPAHQGDDDTVDSDMTTEETHRGYSEAFAVGEASEGRFQISTARDDVEMDMGLRTQPDNVVIGGTLWEDVNKDGKHGASEQRFADYTVVLEEYVGDRWVEVTDLRGAGQTNTDRQGYFEFVVAPTKFDQNTAGYLEPRVYRTMIEMPDGFRISSSKYVTGFQFGDDFMISKDSVTSIVDENGRVAVASFANDLELDFPVEKVLPNLVVTGARGSGLLIASALGALGLGLILVLAARRRENEAEARV